MAKRAKKSKKKTVTEDEDSLDHPVTVAAPIYYRNAPHAVNGVYPAMSDAELERVREYPPWIWAGLYEMGQRLLARLDAAEGRTRKTAKTSSSVTSLD